jgi:hypothetical protein
MKLRGSLALTSKRRVVFRSSRGDVRRHAGLMQRHITDVMTINCFRFNECSDKFMGVDWSLLQVLLSRA